MRKKTDRATQQITSLIDETKHAVSEVVQSVELSQNVFEKLQETSDTTMETISDHHSKVTEILGVIENTSQSADEVVSSMNDAESSMNEAFVMADDAVERSKNILVDIEAMSTKIALSVTGAWNMAKSRPTKRYIYNVETHIKYFGQIIDCSFCDISLGGVKIHVPNLPNRIDIGSEIEIFFPDVGKYLSIYTLQKDADSLTGRFQDRI